MAALCPLYQIKTSADNLIEKRGKKMEAVKATPGNIRDSLYLTKDARRKTLRLVVERKAALMPPELLRKEQEVCDCSTD